MKKGLLLLLFVPLLLLFACNKDNSAGKGCIPPFSCYKGRLEIKGLCSNYTIKVLDNTIDPSLVQYAWKSPKTGETLTNVFALVNKCDFPSTINEGDEFYFRFISDFNRDCGTCEAYYPTPSIAHAISILPAPCDKTND